MVLTVCGRSKTGIFTKLWGFFTGLLVIGIIVYIGMLWYTGQNISVNVERIEELRYNPFKDELSLDIVVEVNNTGLMDVTIDKLYYEVYIDEQYLGRGNREDIVIHRGRNEILLSFNTKTPDAARTLLTTALARGHIRVTVKGYVDIPIKSFGVIRLWTLELSFEPSSTVDVVKK